jgi:hypothetical protein
MKLWPPNPPVGKPLRAGESKGTLPAPMPALEAGYGKKKPKGGKKGK